MIFVRFGVALLANPRRHGVPLDRRRGVLQLIGVPDRDEENISILEENFPGPRIGEVDLPEGLEAVAPSGDWGGFHQGCPAIFG